MSNQSGKRIQPTISQSCLEWVDKHADRWNVSTNVAAAKILEIFSESPWTNLILKDPDAEITIDRMELLLKKKNSRTP